jgi:hypothetical protein
MGASTHSGFRFAATAPLGDGTTSASIGAEVEVLSFIDILPKILEIVALLALACNAFISMRERVEPLIIGMSVALAAFLVYVGISWAPSAQAGLFAVVLFSQIRAIRRSLRAHTDADAFAQGWADRIANGPSR